MDEATEQNNLDRTDSNINIELEKMKVGSSTAYQLSELQIKKAIIEQKISHAHRESIDSFLRLKSLLPGLPDSLIRFELPSKIPSLVLNEQNLLDQAKHNLSLFTTFDIRHLEDLSEIAKASTLRRQINLTASLWPK